MLPMSLRSPGVSGRLRIFIAAYKVQDHIDSADGNTMSLRESGARGRKHVSTLMKRIGIEELYRKPKTIKRYTDTVYPYLLCQLAVSWPNLVWAMALTYIPMAQ